MNKNERNDLWNNGSKKNLRESTEDSRSQIDNFGNKVTHIDNNRTIVNGKTYYGYSAANNALNQLK